MDSSRIPPRYDKPDFGEIMNRVMQFIVCGLIEMGVYIVIMLPLFSLARGLFENDESALNALPSFFFEILFALLYILPLYFLYFRFHLQFLLFYLIHLLYLELHFFGTLILMDFL